MIQIAAEGIAQCRHACRLGILAQNRRHGRRILEATQSEEIIPIGMARLAGVALMADGFRHQPAIGAVIALAIVIGQALLAQGVDVIDRAQHMRPHLAQETDIARIAVILHQRVDQLAMAVMLGDRIGTAGIDTAGHLAIGELVGCVPLQELAHLFGVAHAEQRRRGQGAIANPGA